MHKFRHIASMAAAGLVALLVATCFAAAEDTGQPHAKSATVTRKVTKHVKTSHVAQVQKKARVALATQPPAEQKEHRLILQVNTNDAAAMPTPSPIA